MEKKQELYSKSITKANMLSIAFGAILGSSMRMLCFLGIPEYAIINVIIINIIGSIVFAIVSQFESIVPKNLKLFMLTGFCASFTTFSLTIGQAQIAAQLLDLRNYALALFGNFFMTLFFTLIAIVLTRKIFKFFKGAK